MWRRLAQGVGLGLGLSLCAALPTHAQDLGTIQSQVLILDTERLFLETDFGRRLVKDYEVERTKLIANNRKIEAALEAEERALTAKRAEMTPDEFRLLADAFDEKVQKIRADNERIAGDLEHKREIAPSNFLTQIKPILAQVMRKSGAVVILDARSVLLGIEGIDVTDAAINDINAAIGDGRQFDRGAGQQNAQ